MGKLSSDELQKLLSCIPSDPRVVVPPMVGYDSGVHRLNGGEYMVVASDPCIGVPEEWFGFLLVNYAASDLSLSGAKPQFCTINLLGARSAKPETFQKIMRQTCQAASDLGVAIIRGHTGTYDGVSDLVGVATVYGTVNPERLITAGGAKPGDLILCTKPLGLETLTNFSLTHKALAQKLFGEQQQTWLTGQVPMQSCVREAIQLAQIGGVHAMHDATEGGFVAALNEVAEASNVGFTVNWEQIPKPRELMTLQGYFSLSDWQVLSASSTGTILAAADSQAQKKIAAALKLIGLTLHVIGRFTEEKKRTIIKSGKELDFPEVPRDPYEQIFSGI